MSITLGLLTVIGASFRSKRQDSASNAPEQFGACRLRQL
jgi:hypothetical protein